MTNAELHARSLAAVWHPCTQMKRHEILPLVPIRRGQGAWLYDFDGNRYLDAVSSWWVNLFGHCNPRINAAVADQLGKLEHVMLAGFTHEPVVRLSERLVQLAPAGLGHCFYASDGASATEIALKMSAHYWRNRGKPGKTDFISLQNSYHGETLGALSVTDVALFKDAYGALLKQHGTVVSPDWRNAAQGESAQDFALRCAEALEHHLQQHHDSLAAFIIEPLVQGAAGMAMYHPVYLRRARELCDRYEVHLIADEIAVGMGRTGTMFACEQAPPLPMNLKPGRVGCGDEGTASFASLTSILSRRERRRSFFLPPGGSLKGGAVRGLTTSYGSVLRSGSWSQFGRKIGDSGLSPEGQGDENTGITPDFLLLSKGITGGYLPLSVVMCADNIYQAFYSDEVAHGFLHSHSYTGNPLACRAALATLDIFEQDDVLSANRSKAAYINRISAPLREHPRVRNFRNTGMIWAFEVDSTHADFAQRCFALALQRELLLRPMGNTVYFMPPYVINEEEMEMLVTRTLDIVESLP